VLLGRLRLSRTEGTSLIFSDIHWRITDCVVSLFLVFFQLGLSLSCVLPLWIHVHEDLMSLQGSIGDESALVSCIFPKVRTKSIDWKDTEQYSL
jgi:hypothetical protein